MASRGRGTVPAADPRAVRRSGQSLLFDRTAVGRRRDRPARHPPRPRPRAGGQRQRPVGAGRLRHLPDVTMFKTILIANRGEIAVRITRTLRRLGIRSVTIYTGADEGARHVLEANLALKVRSYLDAEDILSVAHESGAEAIHPGYGFLAENAGFAHS